MKLRDVENRLEMRLPLITGRFTREVSVTSAVPSGTTVTVTTSAAHGLTAGQSVLVAGVSAPVGIVSIDRSGETALVTTAQDHDLTERWFDSVTLGGFNESEFNGEFDLITVPNRRTFTISLPDSGPTSGTGSPLLIDPGLPFGFNGLTTVASVPAETAFTYTANQPLPIAGQGDSMRIIKGLRIYSAVSFERAESIFESKDINSLSGGDLSLFVVGGDVVSNRDRSALNDSVSSASASSSNRQQVIQSVTCVVFQKVTGDLSGAGAYDDMQQTAADIIRVLAGWSPPSEFSVDSGNTLRFVSHGLLRYDSAVYVHGVEFQVVEEINTEDLDIVPDNVAFRDIFGALSDTGLTLTIDLDEDPLP